MALDVASLLLGIGIGLFAIVCVRAVDVVIAKLAEPTLSQKMRDAGYTRRPKGWDKEPKDEPVYTNPPQRT